MSWENQTQNDLAEKIRDLEDKYIETAAELHFTQERMTNMESFFCARELSDEKIHAWMGV